jgi:hypothetical protein
MCTYLKITSCFIIHVYWFLKMVSQGPGCGWASHPWEQRKSCQGLHAVQAWWHWMLCKICVFNKFLPDLHTRRSPTQSDTYQMLYWYNWFSWWWARVCSKHLENWNKHTEKELCVKLAIKRTLQVCYHSYLIHVSSAVKTKSVVSGTEKMIFMKTTICYRPNLSFELAPTSLPKNIVSEPSLS